MDNMLKSLQALKEASSPFPHSKAIQTWKSQGKKVVGWICTYVPEELIAAAGMLPVRVIGRKAEDIIEADAYLYTNICSFARSCLEVGLKDDYGFLDGIVAGTSCDPIRRLYDVWNTYLTTPFKHILSVPHKVTSDSEAFFAGEIRQLKGLIESHFGVKISEGSLRETIQIYNRGRELLKKLYELRKEEIPLVSGEEVLKVIQASMRMPREDFNEHLERLLDEVSHRRPSTDRRIRLLVAGGMLDSPEFMASVESLGAWVVGDELCAGSRYFWNQVDTSLEPIEALAQGYLNHPPCARMRPFEKRLNFIQEMIREFKADGVISEAIKFCDVYGHDKPLVKEKLETSGIPVLELDLEYGMGSLGQIRTRVEAFLEMIKVKQ